MPVILKRTQAAILAYRENPVTTGLDDIRPWMTVQYIANSTGVPAEYLFEQLDIPAEGNAFKPLQMLAREVGFREGPRGLSEAIKSALNQYEATPGPPIFRTCPISFWPGLSPSVRRCWLWLCCWGRWAFPCRAP